MTAASLYSGPEQAVKANGEAPTRTAIAPYITSWSNEPSLSPPVLARLGLGVYYADELLTDRDSHGVLWQRAGMQHGVGRPEFGRVHPLRQRRAMRKLLCQVCAEPADRNIDGVLWLLRDYRDDWACWPEGMGCVEPPVCASCIPISMRLCPALRRGAVVVRVREFPISGIRGALYRYGQAGLVAAEDATLPYEDPEVRWLVASALVRELKDCTVLPLGEFVESSDSV